MIYMEMFGTIKKIEHDIYYKFLVAIDFGSVLFYNFSVKK